jgi:hypothetical protein
MNKTGMDMSVHIIYVTGSPPLSSSSAPPSRASCEVL